AEGEAVLEGAYGHRPDPGGDDLGHVAVEQAHGEARDGGEGGSAQGAPEGAGEVAVGRGLGCAGVDRALPGGAVDRREVAAADVVDVDPGQVLAASRHGAADAQ